MLAPRLIDAPAPVIEECRERRVFCFASRNDHRAEKTVPLKAFMRSNCDAALGSWHLSLRRLRSPSIAFALLLGFVPVVSARDALYTWGTTGTGGSGTSSLYTFTSTPTGQGSFNRQFTLPFSHNQNLSGASARRDLTIHASVIVVPEPGAIALAGIGMAGV